MLIFNYSLYRFNPCDFKYCNADAFPKASDNGL